MRAWQGYINPENFNPPSKQMLKVNKKQDQRKRRNMFKVNKKDTRTTLFTSYQAPISSVTIIDFDEINVC